MLHARRDVRDGRCFSRMAFLASLRPSAPRAGQCSNRNFPVIRLPSHSSAKKYRRASCIRFYFSRMAFLASLRPSAASW